MPKPSRQLPIAIFDSGVGGLTVLKAIGQLLPDENLLYLGDTARVPYGTRSRDTIARYSLQAAEKLVSAGAKMLVIACNTATAAALDILQDAYPQIPVLGVIEPGAESAIEASKNGCIAVIATEATINGRAYHNAIGRLAPGARVLGKACTLFVPLAEEGWLTGIVAEKIAERYLSEIFATGEDNAPPPDTLLLGCTHFPLLCQTLRKVIGPHVAIVDSAQATARKAREILEQNCDLRPAAASPYRKFMITDNPDRFMRTGTAFLGRPIEPDELEVIDL